ncbi:MAG: CYCXC family (seleno)protein [Candidatus Korobacteraceae bacterium]
MKKPALLVLIALLTAVCVAQGDHVPAYHNGALKAGEASPILPKDQLWGEAFQYPYQVRAYELAAKIPSVLNQMPCYCYCERIGHSSLHTCFESTHGAHCGICMKEVFYTYEQNKLKKTPAQIRAGIIRGDWKDIDLESAAKSD